MKGKRKVSSLLVQPVNTSNHKTIEMIPFSWHDRGLKGHAVAELVLGFSSSDKSKLFITHGPFYRLSGI